MSTNERPVVLTPGNEPYLGRTLLHEFDKLICAVMEQNGVTAPKSHKLELTSYQRMACLVIPQALSITLSIRELIRQGYLFGANILVRALVERAAILIYLNEHPSDIVIWERGWHSPEAPGLAKMFDRIQAKQQRKSVVPGKNLTAAMNDLLHSKPRSAQWNLIDIGQDHRGHADSKILNRPELCDEICANTIPWLVVIQGMMSIYFADPPAN